MIFILETEKYAHVTFFFNGGIEKQYEGEERSMIQSPKVATYDKQPEMSVQEVADKVADVVGTKEYDFVMCNFAPPDMVGVELHPIPSFLIEKARIARYKLTLLFTRLVILESTAQPSPRSERPTRPSRLFTMLPRRQDTFFSSLLTTEMFVTLQAS